MQMYGMDACDGMADIAKEAVVYHYFIELQDQYRLQLSRIAQELFQRTIRIVTTPTRENCDFCLCCYWLYAGGETIKLLVIYEDDQCDRPAAEFRPDKSSSVIVEDGQVFLQFPEKTFHAEPITRLAVIVRCGDPFDPFDGWK